MIIVTILLVEMDNKANIKMKLNTKSQNEM